MKNENNHEVEELLKDKMSRLSESVDCFDRISARAFPEKDEDFSESGFTVSDLENVTAKARKHSIIRWTAVAAAAVVCIAVIPQTNLIGCILNIGSGSVRKSYESLISEIDSETRNGDYLIADYPLDEYIINDLLITPLFACPFEDCGKDDANVRIYTRLIDGLTTNQVYAIEYIGEFAEENIIAAAKSEYTFSAEDIALAKETDYSNFSEYYECSHEIECYFSADSDGLFTDSEDNEVSLASFVDFSLIKYDDRIIPITSRILYGHQTLDDNAYFYDIISLSNGEEIQLTERDKAWEKSIYFNGNTAMPEESQSVFSAVNLFHAPTAELRSECMFVLLSGNDYQSDYGRFVTVNADDSGKCLNSIIMPTNQTYISSTYLYFSASAFSDGISVNVKSDSDNLEFVLNDTPAYDFEKIAEEKWQQVEEQLRISEEYFNTNQAEQNPSGSAE